MSWGSGPVWKKQTVVLRMDYRLDIHAVLDQGWLNVRGGRYKIENNSMSIRRIRWVVDVVCGLGKDDNVSRRSRSSRKLMVCPWPILLTADGVWTRRHCQRWWAGGHLGLQHRHVNSETRVKKLVTSSIVPICSISEYATDQNRIYQCLGIDTFHYM